jgi:hypothetical protein
MGVFMRRDCERVVVHGIRIGTLPDSSIGGTGAGNGEYHFPDASMSLETGFPTDSISLPVFDGCRLCAAKAELVKRTSCKSVL